MLIKATEIANKLNTALYNVSVVFDSSEAQERIANQRRQNGAKWFVMKQKMRINDE